MLTMTIGVDFGGDALRFAIEANDASADPVSIAPLPMPRVVRRIENTAGGNGVGVQVLSIKRLLDFDAALPVPPDGKNSVDFLGGKLSGVRATLEEKASNAVLNWAVAVPPCFSQRQRSAIRTACVDAGLLRVRLIDDTRAVLAASGAKLERKKDVLVCLWGASTFSAAVYRRSESDWQAVAQAGDAELGGDEITSAACWAAMESLDAMGLRLSEDTIVQLASRVVPQVLAATPALMQGSRRSLDLAQVFGNRTPTVLRQQSVELSADVCVSRSEEMTTDALDVARQVLQDGHGRKPDCVLLAGGMTGIPAVEVAFGNACSAPTVRADKNATLVGALLLAKRVKPQEWSDSERRAAPRLARHAAGSPTNASALTWPQHFIPILEKAETAERSGRTEDAVSAVDELFRELSEFTGELYRRQADRLQRSGESASAHALLRTACSRDGASRAVVLDYARLCYRLGLSAYEREKTEDALRYADDGTKGLRAFANEDKESRPTLAALLHLRGCTLSRRGRFADAAASLEESVGLMPEEKRYQEDLNAVARMLNESRKRQPASLKRIKGSMRNAPCPCGSGKKYKHCCGT